MKTVQEVNNLLKKTLTSKSRSVGGTSINNCIITNDEHHMIFSYFDAFHRQSKIELELISIKINTDNESVEVLRGALDFQSYFRISAKETDQVQIHVQANLNNKQLYLVEIKMKGKEQDNKKSKFFLFQCTYQAIVSKEPLLMVEIMANKAINRIHWHPAYNNLFVALTSDSFVLYSIEESENYTQIEVTHFKSLQIREKILDFSFWGNTKSQGPEEKYFLSALGQTKTYILSIRGQQQEDLSQASEKSMHLGYQNDPSQLVTLHQIMDSQKKASWERIKVIKTIYNRKEKFLVLKSSYIYKNDKRQSLLEIYEMSADHAGDNKGQYEQRIIVSIQYASQINTAQFEFPVDDLKNSSLLYYHDGKVIRLNLSKFLNSITSQHNKLGKIYAPTEQDNELLLNIGNDQAKFIFFEHGGLTLLRISKEGGNYDFSRMSPEMLELDLGEKSIAQKVKKLIESMEKQISKNQEPNEAIFIDKQEFVPLSEQASEAEVEKFVNETQKFMKRSEDYLRNEKAALNNLYDEIKKSCLKLEGQYKKKERVNSLLQRIEKNGEQIERLLSNDAAEMGYFDEKINEIQGMVEFVSSKPLELEKDAREMFTADIEAHLKKAEEIEEMIRQAEKGLDGRF